MGYEKTNWSTGDVVTAEKLNKIENGLENISGSDVFVVKSLSYDAEYGMWSEVDKTFAEIEEAVEANKIPILYLIDGKEVDVYYFVGKSSYQIQFSNVEINSSSIIEKRAAISDSGVNKSTTTFSKS